jgi:Type IV secretion-system coupling protein DNA-binding domain
VTLLDELARIAAVLGPIALAAGAAFPAALGIAALGLIMRARGAPTATPFAGRRRNGRLLGLASTRGVALPVMLSIEDSRQHLHLLGPTGTGKSTLLLNLAAQDIAEGRGCAVLDPKGDLVRDLLARIPRRRLGDVVYIGPDAADRSVGINPLELRAGEDRELAAENTLAIFKRIYHDHWGPRTDDVLKSALLTLLQTERPTLAQIPLLLGDTSFRLRVTRELHDPIGLESFWRWYEGLTDPQRGEVIGPVLNKLRDFLLRARLRRLLCQERSTVDLGALIDGGGILLADLGTGRWGEGASALAGSFLVARLWQAALARQALAERDRRDFFLYIDEFQNFLGIRGPFADALAQARGLHLSLTIANQHLGQLPRDLQEAVRSNAQSRVVFRCGSQDAASLAHEFAPLDAGALLALPRFAAAARLGAGGQVPRVLRLRTLPPVRRPADALPPEVAIAAAMAYHGRAAGDIDRALQGDSSRRRSDDRAAAPAPK